MNDPYGHQKKFKSLNNCSTQMQAMMECMASCLNCVKQCTEDGQKSDDHKKITALCAECADMCCITMKSMCCQSEFCQQMMDLCCQMCNRCAEECQNCEDQHCQECAKACRKCAEACSVANQSAM